MSDQRDLFGGLPPFEKSSPTSKEAALHIRKHAPRLRRKVLAAIERTGSRGTTDRELEELLDMRHETVSARRRELEQLGFIVKTDRKRPTPSGRSAAVYVVRGGANE